MFSIWVKNEGAFVMKLENTKFSKKYLKNDIFNEKLDNTYQFVKKYFWKILLNVAVYVLLIEFVFIFIFPYLFMMINSLKYDFDLRNINTQWIVTRLNYFNYTEAYIRMSYLEGLRNNMIIITGSLFGHVLSCALIAYGLARFKFPGRNLVFSIIILSIIIPPQLLLIPLYIQFARLGWVGSYLPIVIPTFFGFGLKGGLFIFIFRQFLKGLPQSYEEAAKIEGAGYLSIFFKIIMPMAKTSVLVVAILSTIWHWNDYFEPTIFLSGTNVMLFQRLGRINFWQGINTSTGSFINPIMLAAIVMITVPLLLIYFIFQKQFMKGIEHTGLAN